MTARHDQKRFSSALLQSMTGQSEIANAKKPVGRVGRCNGGAIKKAVRRISLIYDKALAPTGLKITQYGILSAINARGAALPTMHELAKELVMDRSTLGQNLRPLERAELIAILTVSLGREVSIVFTSNGPLIHRWEANKELYVDS